MYIHSVMSICAQEVNIFDRFSVDVKTDPFCNKGLLTTWDKFVSQKNPIILTPILRGFPQNFGFWGPKDEYFRRKPTYYRYNETNPS